MEEAQGAHGRCGIMRIYIPTYRRAYNQRTFKALPGAWQDAITFVTDEYDKRGINLAMTRTRDMDFMVVPDTVKTIAQKRAHIFREAHKAGETTIVVMDDDLRFDYRQDPDVTKLSIATPGVIGMYLGQLEDKLQTFAHAGFSARQGNNRMPGGWKEPSCRSMYVLGYNVPKVMRICQLGRIETREDFDYTLQLLRAGFPNTVCADVSVDQLYGKPGGCTGQRTVETSNADADLLAELHPGFIRVVNKKYGKTSVDRKEVVVSWQKALESSSAR